MAQWMRTDNLDLLDIEQLKQFGLWMAWAERHAVRELERVDGDWSFSYKNAETAAISTRLRWKSEIDLLNKTQSAVRLQVEDMVRKKRAESTN